MTRKGAVVQRVCRTGRVNRLVLWHLARWAVEQILLLGRGRPYGLRANSESLCRSRDVSWLLCHAGRFRRKGTIRNQAKHSGGSGRPRGPCSSGRPRLANPPSCSGLVRMTQGAPPRDRAWTCLTSGHWHSEVQARIGLCNVVKLGHPLSGSQFSMLRVFSGWGAGWVCFGPEQCSKRRCSSRARDLGPELLFRQFSMLHHSGIWERGLLRAMGVDTSAGPFVGERWGCRLSPVVVVTVFRCLLHFSIVGEVNMYEAWAHGCRPSQHTWYHSYNSSWDMARVWAGMSSRHVHSVGLIRSWLGCVLKSGHSRVGSQFSMLRDSSGLWAGWDPGLEQYSKLRCPSRVRDHGPELPFRQSSMLHHLDIWERGLHWALGLGTCAGPFGTAVAGLRLEPSCSPREGWAIGAYGHWRQSVELPRAPRWFFASDVCLGSLAQGEWGG